MNRIQKLLLFLLLLLAILLPRATELKRFVTVDENRWLTRSGNFYRALSTGKLEQTYQIEHPGVTIMWLGSAAFWWHYPAYGQKAPDEFKWKDEQIERFLLSQGYDPLDILATGRFLVALAITVVLGAAFLMARRLLGESTAIIAFFLIAFDPFHVALSRQLHLDGMMSSLMFFSLLAFLLYLYSHPPSASGRAPAPPRRRGGRRQLFFLVLSAIGAGLAWLTRTPSVFLVPFIGLVALLDWAYRRWQGQGQIMGQGLLRTSEWASGRKAETTTTTAKSFGAGRCRFAPSPKSHQAPSHPPLQKTIAVLFLWGMIGVAVFVVMWPTMWVAPFAALQEAISEGLEQAGGHPSPLFFDGQIIEGDPGIWFYPVNFLWRTTPVMLVGILSALLAYFLRLRPLDKANTRQVFAVLMLFALTFMLFVTLGDKKFDRYMLPIFAPLDLVAGMGWVATCHLMGRRGNPGGCPQGQGQALPLQWVLLVMVLVVQAGLTLRMAPYYLGYYNPLLGGISAAPDVMMIGWGDGLEKAADYLNRKPDAKQLQVMAWYWEGSFSYFFDGRAKALWERSGEGLEELLDWATTDYVALYIHKWQREPLTTPIRQYFSQRTPEHVVTLHGIEYAWIYNVQGELPPAELLSAEADFIDWGDSIRLVAHKRPDEPIMAGDSLFIEFYLQNLAPIERDLHVLMRIIGQDGQEVARSEGWPWGTPTSTWQPYDLWPDGHEFVLPADSSPGFYRIELSFYDPNTLEHLQATDPYADQPLGETVVVDYLALGQANGPTSAGRSEAPSPLSEGSVSFASSPTFLGEQIQLLGADVETTEDEGDRDEGDRDEGDRDEGDRDEGDRDEGDRDEGDRDEGDRDEGDRDEGSPLQVRLFWQPVKAVERNYTTFVHLIGPDGQLITQQDQQPLGGFLPTSLWRANEVIPDDYELQLPPDLPQGSYELRVGMYDPTTLERLPVTIGGEAAGDFVVVGQVETDDITHQETP